LIEPEISRVSGCAVFAQALTRGFLTNNEIHIAGIEFILDKDGELYTYDINTNTNYNPTAETEAGVSGMRRIAEYLGDQLEEVAENGVNRRRIATS
jgi:hypothetical protein